MVGGMINVSRGRPCPICGKPDWCSICSPDTDEELVICKRSSDVQGDVTGVDGRLYKFCGLTKYEYPRFQEYSKWEAQHDAWLRENHKGKYRESGRGSGYDRWYGATKGNPAAPVTKPREYEVVDPVNVKSHRELDRFYRALLSVLVLDELHYNYLRKEGWSKELIVKSGVKSFPAKDIIRFNHEMNKSRNFYRKRIAKAVMQKLGVSDLRGYPGAYTDKGGNWTLNGPSGLALPIYDADGYMYGIRIRMDFCDVDRTLEQRDGQRCYTHEGITYYHQPMKGFYHFEGDKKVFDNFYYDDRGYMVEVKGKYRPISSYQEDQKERENHRIVNRLTNGCRAENGISVYFNPEVDNPYVVYFTEGEKKGIFANGVMKAPVVTFPGVGSWRPIFQGENGGSLVDKLKAHGCRICVIAYDADKESNKEVLTQQQKVVGALLEEGFQVGLATWPQKQGKGLDDCLVAGYVPGFELMK